MKVILLLLINFLLPTYALAVYQQISPTISTDGYVTFNCPEGSSNITQYYNYEGVYPDTVRTVNYGNPTIVCSLASNGSFTLEKGLFNETGSTTDGYYWTQFQMDGVGSVDYYFTATRYLGHWYTTSPQIPASTTPYAVLISPPNNSYTTGEIELSIAWNSAQQSTSTLFISLLSLDQNLDPYEYSTTTTIQPKSTTYSFTPPYLDDIIYLRFYVYNSSTTDGVPSYISKEYTLNYVANGDVENFTPESFVTSTECASDSLAGGFCRVFQFLFIPQRADLEPYIEQISSSSVPLVSTAYQAFASVTEISETSSTSVSTSSLAIKLTIPEANINQDIFSVPIMMYLMGSSASTIRLIAQMALWLGLIGMVIYTINQMFQVNISNRK